jgi:hypothetical protein
MRCKAVALHRLEEFRDVLGHGRGFVVVEAIEIEVTSNHESIARKIDE